MNKTRVILLCLAALMLLLPLSACNQNLEGLDEGYLLQNGMETRPETVLTIDGSNISFAEYRHFFFNAKLELEALTPDYFEQNETAEENLKDLTLSYLKEAHALESIAAEHDIALEADELEEVQKTLSQKRSELGDELYVEFLSDAYLTEEVYLTFLKNNALYEKVYQTFIKESGILHITEEELAEYVKENYFCYAQIYVDFRKGEGTNTHEQTDKDVSAILSRLEKGDDFYAVAFSHSDDQTMMDYKNGYLKKKDIFSENTAKALAELEENEISDPVLESDGYYIYLKLPVGEKVLEENRDFLLYGYTDVNENHTNGLYEDRFYEMIANRAEKSKVTYADCYDLISSETLQ